MRRQVLWIVSAGLMERKDEAVRQEASKMSAAPSLDTHPANGKPGQEVDLSGKLPDRHAG